MPTRTPYGFMLTDAARQVLWTFAQGGTEQLVGAQCALTEGAEEANGGPIGVEFYWTDPDNGHLEVPLANVDLTQKLGSVAPNQLPFGRKDGATLIARATTNNAVGVTLYMEGGQG